MKHITIVVTLFLSVTLTGCTSVNPQGRIAVEGTVTLNGKPLAEGNVEFASLPGLTPAVATGAVIKEGKFSIPAEFGLIPGQEYTVRFRAVEEVPGTRRKTDDPMFPETADFRDLVPPKWGSESKETIKASEAKTNKFAFELTQ